MAWTRSIHYLEVVSQDEGAVAFEKEWRLALLERLDLLIQALEVQPVESRRPYIPPPKPMTAPRPVVGGGDGTDG